MSEVVIKEQIMEMDWSVELADDALVMEYGKTWREFRPDCDCTVIRRRDSFTHGTEYLCLKHPVPGQDWPAERSHLQESTASSGGANG